MTCGVWTDRPFWSTHKEPPAKTRPEVITFQREQFAAQLEMLLSGTTSTPSSLNFRSPTASANSGTHAGSGDS